MREYLKDHEKLEGEKVLDVIPAKPFTLFIVTNLRVIGKSFLRIGFNRFEERILFNKIKKISYKPAKSSYFNPSMLIEYEAKNGNMKEASIIFPSSYAFRARWNPEKTYHIILEQINRS